MRIGKLDLAQLNKQLDRLEPITNRLSAVEKELATTTFQTNQLDFVHDRQTFNNLTFTWTGGTNTLSWTGGWIRDKNTLIGTGTAFSQSPSFRFATGAPVGLTHNIAVIAGSLVINPSVYYWLGWDTDGSKMYAQSDITNLITHHNMQIICQIYTGTAGQTGLAGGGGSQGGADLSGARYKLF